MHWVPKFGRFQIAHKIWRELNVWNRRYVELVGQTGVFALLDRSRYVGVPRGKFVMSRRTRKMRAGS